MFEIFHNLIFIQTHMILEACAACNVFKMKLTLDTEYIKEKASVRFIHIHNSILYVHEFCHTTVRHGTCQKNTYHTKQNNKTQYNKQCQNSSPKNQYYA